MKLTDEEIIDSLENLAKDGCCQGWVITEKDILDLIHRLQSENETLKTELRKECEEHEKFTQKAKAEIERLTSIAEFQQNSNTERYRIIQEKDKKIAEQKAEIERLKGFLSSFKTVIAEQQEQIEKKVERVYPDFMRDYKLCKNDLKECLERNAELQKQVDELTEDLEKAYATERDNIRAEIANAGTTCHWCYEQAVKDTAKEILQGIFDEQFEVDVDIDENSKDDVVKVGKAVLTAIHEKIELMADRYGVEVE